MRLNRSAPLHLLIAVALAMPSAALAQEEEKSRDEKDGEVKEFLEEIKTTEELVLSGKGYDYDSKGRPDPFVNPLRESTGDDEADARPDGWPGMLINEVKLHGITLYGSEPIAIFLGTDGVGYFKTEGDELWDGKIEVIDFDQSMVVFKQKVDDPSSPRRHRRVERRLNP